MKAWVAEIVEQVPGKKIQCRGRVPEDLEVFQDHFPDFPVLPGVLALDILRESVDLCVRIGRPENEASSQSLISARSVKFQHFLRPGEAWESYAEYLPGEPTGSWNVKLMVQNRTAVSARMLFSSINKLVTEV